MRGFVRDPSRRWRISTQPVFGPWISLGIHVDFSTPLIDLHLLWWVITMGWIYGKD